MMCKCGEKCGREATSNPRLPGHDEYCNYCTFEQHWNPEKLRLTGHDSGPKKSMTEIIIEARDEPLLHDTHKSQIGLYTSDLNHSDELKEKAQSHPGNLIAEMIESYLRENPED